MNSVDAPRRERYAATHVFESDAMAVLWLCFGQHTERDFQTATPALFTVVAGRVRITFPTGEMRRLSPGRSVVLKSHAPHRVTALDNAEVELTVFTDAEGFSD
jgi:quercetin dioxygenase-like cupin family protein